jgi:hypothetical membrane protein
MLDSMVFAILISAAPHEIGAGARLFLLVVLVATSANDWYIWRSVSSKLRDKGLSRLDQAAVVLMSFGAVVFGLAVQLACVTVLFGNQPIDAWPTACRIGVTLFSLSGIGIVLVGIALNVKAPR